MGASLQYAANAETREVRLQQNSLASRNAVFGALQNLQLPSQFSKVDVVASFNDSFRLIHSDTPDLSSLSFDEPSHGEYVVDALDEFAEKLTRRQTIQRASDREAALNITRITRCIQLQDDPDGMFTSIKSPSQYILDCPNGHTVGGSQLRANGINTMASLPINQPRIR